MFGWLKRDPVKALEQEYARKLVEARDVQRNGDIVGYSAIVAEAEEIRARIDELEQNSEASA